MARIAGRVVNYPRHSTDPWRERWRRSGWCLRALAGRGGAHFRFLPVDATLVLFALPARFPTPQFFLPVLTVQRLVARHRHFARQRSSGLRRLKFPGRPFLLVLGFLRSCLIPLRSFRTDNPSAENFNSFVTLELRHALPKCGSHLLIQSGRQQFLRCNPPSG